MIVMVRAGAAAEGGQHSEQHAEHDDPEQDVDQLGGEARSATGERVPQLDTFRRRDRDRVLILHGGEPRRFHARGQPEWTELDALVRRARGRPDSLGAEGVLRLGALYRSAIGDLAQGRRAFPGDPSVRALEQLVGRARATVYAPVRRRGSALHYVTGGYWRAVREQGRVLLLAWALLLGSTVLALVWALHDPASAAGVVPGSLSSGGSAPQHAIGLGAGQSAAISVTIFTNNIGVTFLAFATGIAFGVLPAFVLLYNGVVARGSRRDRRGGRPLERPRRADRAPWTARVVVHRRVCRGGDADGLGAGRAGPR